MQIFSLKKQRFFVAFWLMVFVGQTLATSMMTCHLEDIQNTSITEQSNVILENDPSAHCIDMVDEEGVSKNHDQLCQCPVGNCGTSFSLLYPTGSQYYLTNLSASSNDASAIFFIINNLPTQLYRPPIFS